MVLTNTGAIAVGTASTHQSGLGDADDVEDAKMVAAGISNSGSLTICGNGYLHAPNTPFQDVTFSCTCGDQRRHHNYKGGG